jgi:hypothetical protein
MGESRNRAAVSPSPREAGDGWVLDAVFPNGKQAAIAGFRTESEANNWLGSAGHVTWLRGTRATFCRRSAAAIFEWLALYALALLDLATEFCETILHRLRAIDAVRIGSRGISTIAVRLRDSGWLDVASDLARRWSTRRSGSSLRRRTVYRCLLVATMALLILVIALAILIAVLVMLAHGDPPARFASEPTHLIADRPIVPSRSTEATEASDPIALLIDRVSSSEIAVEPTTEAAAQSPPQSAGDQALAVDTPAATPRPDVRRAGPPAIVGVWAPETGSCSAREGVLRTIIDERGARAGETSCVFKERRGTESDRRMLANCTNGHERWTSNVRLIVKGDRLVWTSKRGTQAYTRCRSNI